MDLATILGLCAGTLTTAGLLPQFYKAWKSRSTHDISLPAYVILDSGITLWLVYGILISDLPLIAANAVSLVLASGIIVLKLRYG